MNGSNKETTRFRDAFRSGWRSAFEARSRFNRGAFIVFLVGVVSVSVYGERKAIWYGLLFLGFLGAVLIRALWLRHKRGTPTYS